LDGCNPIHWGGRKTGEGWGKKKKSDRSFWLSRRRGNQEAGRKKAFGNHDLKRAPGYAEKGEKKKGGGPTGDLRDGTGGKRVGMCRKKRKKRFSPWSKRLSPRRRVGKKECGSC